MCVCMYVFLCVCVCVSVCVSVCVYDCVVPLHSSLVIIQHVSWSSTKSSMGFISRRLGGRRGEGGGRE